MCWLLIYYLFSAVFCCYYHYKFFNFLKQTKTVNLRQICFYTVEIRKGVHSCLLFFSSRNPDHRINLYADVRFVFALNTIHGSIIEIILSSYVTGKVIPLMIWSFRSPTSKQTVGKKFKTRRTAEFQVKTEKMLQIRFAVPAPDVLVKEEMRASYLCVCATIDHKLE